MATKVQCKPETMEIAKEYFARKFSEGINPVRKSLAQLSKEMGLSPVTTYKATMILEEEGLLEIEHGEGSQPNTYTWKGGGAAADIRLIDRDKAVLVAQLIAANQTIEFLNNRLHELEEKLDDFKKLCIKHGIREVVPGPYDMG